MRQNFSNNWFGVIKNSRTSNPLSLYPYEEIVEIFKKKNEYEKLYGYYPIKYIGNLVGFRNLKGDYLHSRDFSNTMSLDFTTQNFSISQITFSLRVIVGANKLVRFDIELHIASDSGVTLNLLRNEVITKKMFSDFVEIYNQPNHGYKNMYANMATDHIKKLKDIFSEDGNYNFLSTQYASIVDILRELKL